MFSVLTRLLFSWFILRKNCAMSNIKIIEKGAHLNFAMGASLHRYATAWRFESYSLCLACGTRFRYSSLIQRRGRHVFVSRVFDLLAHRPRLLFCCRAIAKEFSAAAAAKAYQKPFVHKDMCTRKSVKQTMKRVRANSLLRLGIFKFHAVLIGSQKSARTPTKLLGC